jgi:hypothetical protein
MEGKTLLDNYSAAAQHLTLSKGGVVVTIKAVSINYRSRRALIFKCPCGARSNVFHTQPVFSQRTTLVIALAVNIS